MITIKYTDKTIIDNNSSIIKVNNYSVNINKNTNIGFHVDYNKMTGVIHIHLSGITTKEKSLKYYKGIKFQSVIFENETCEIKNIKTNILSGEYNIIEDKSTIIQQVSIFQPKNEYSIQGYMNIPCEIVGLHLDIICQMNIKVQTDPQKI